MGEKALSTPSRRGMQRSITSRKMGEKALSTPSRRGMQRSITSRTMADSSLVAYDDPTDENNDSGKDRMCFKGVDLYTLGIALFILAVYLLGGIMWYSWWEQWSYVDALYFSVVCTTTVGYGDLQPSD